MARGVDDVDAMVFPEARGSSRSNGDTALLFLNHPVHGGATIVNFTDLVVLTGVIENPLGRGGLARINVGHDADIAGLFKRMRA